MARAWPWTLRPARELLAPIYGRFIEGFGSADLRAAKALLVQTTEK